MDRFAAGYSILFAVLFESIAISWIYGMIEKTNSNLKKWIIFMIFFSSS